MQTPSKITKKNSQGIIFVIISCRNLISPEVVSLGLGVARAILVEEPRTDPRPWVRGCENELVTFDQAVTQASCRKRAAESWDEWWAATREVRRCKRRRTAWLRDKEVLWWDDLQTSPQKIKGFGGWLA